MQILGLQFPRPGAMPVVGFITSPETFSYATTVIHPLTLSIGHFPGLPRQNKITTWAFKHRERNTKRAMLDYTPPAMQNTHSWFYCPPRTWHLLIKSQLSPQPQPLITTILPASGRWTWLDSTHDMQCWSVCGWLISPGKTSSELTHSITNDRMAEMMDALISWI